jgi:hypothetical protein
MQFRIGVNLGDVIEEGERIYGDGVNIAARLESLAEPGGICVSKTAFDQIETKLPMGYEYLGEQPVKNIAKPVGAYRVVLESGYQTFPLKKDGALQTRSIPPSDLPTPDKRCGNSPRSVHGYRRVKIRALCDLQAVHRGHYGLALLSARPTV